MTVFIGRLLHLFGCFISLCLLAMGFFETDLIPVIKDREVVFSIPPRCSRLTFHGICYPLPISPPPYFSYLFKLTNPKFRAETSPSPTISHSLGHSHLPYPLLTRTQMIRSTRIAITGYVCKIPCNMICINYSYVIPRKCSRYFLPSKTNCTMYHVVETRVLVCWIKAGLNEAGTTGCRCLMSDLYLILSWRISTLTSSLQHTVP